MEAQAESPPMHDIAVAIEDMRPIVVRVPVIEREELVFDGNLGAGRGRDRREQVERAPEFLVEDGAGQVVSVRRISIDKELAAELVIRLVDRDVLPERAPAFSGLATCCRSQSTKPAASLICAFICSLPGPARELGATSGAANGTR